MDKLPQLSSQVKFYGNIDVNTPMSRKFTGTVVGYGHVTGDIWHNEPEQVVLVALHDSLNSVLAVSPSGLEYADR